MNKIQRLTLAFVQAMAALSIPAILAAAKELAALTISGPGIQGEVTINDPGEMQKVLESGIVSQPNGVKPPENLGQGYKLTVFLNWNGKVMPLFEMLYYPAEAGQPGYIHHTGRLRGDTIRTSEIVPVDEWGRLPSQADIALRGLAAAHGITFQPAVIVQAKNISAAPSASSAVVVASTPVRPAFFTLAVMGAGLILAAGLVWRRRGFTRWRASSD